MNQLSANAWPAVLTLLSACAYFPFVYGHAFGEWDGYRVAAGVIDEVRRDLGVGAAEIRNNSVSYAYSFLVLAFRGPRRPRSGSR